MGQFGKKTKLAAIFLCLFAGKSYASGWTQDAGKGIYYQNVSYYSTNNLFDNAGNKQSINGSYRKYETNPYVEYGLRDDLTIGADFFVDNITQTDIPLGVFSQNNYGIGDSEIFLRKRIFHGDNFSIALQPMVKFPSLTKTGTQPLLPVIGDENYNTGVTLSGGYSFEAFGQHHFVDVDAGYVRRFGLPKNQLKFTGTAGFALSPKWAIMPQIFITSRFHKGNNVTRFASGDDYNLTKLQLSAVYKVSDKLAVQVGIFSDVAGKNVLAGNGMIFSIQKNF